MPSAARPLLALAIALAIAVPSAPSAALAAAPPNDAAAHFDRGVRFYAEGDYPAALVEFRRAYEIAPNWQVLFNLGQTYFQLRDYANALVTLRRFVREGGNDIRKDDRATVDPELADLVNRVGTVTVRANVDGASVSIDDQVVGTTPMHDPVLVSAGTRRITALAPGRAPIERRVAIAGGDAITVALDFAPAAAPGAPRGAERPAGRNLTPAYVGLAVGVAGAAVGTVFGFLAVGDKSNLDKTCTPGASGKDCPQSSSGDLDALTRNGTISTIGFGVGAVGLVAGLVLWITAGPASETPTTSTSLRFGPGSVAGSF
jgi:hypothetical protein